MILRVVIFGTVMTVLTGIALAQTDGSNPQSQAPSPTAQDSRTVVGTDGQTYRVGVGVSPPKAIYTPDPEYSEEARDARYQGTSVLWLIVDPVGKPQKIRVQRALGMGLDEEAVKAVRQWRFQPAQKAGKPVAVVINVEVNFRLSNGLTPHPESFGEPPRFPGVKISKYPLVIRTEFVTYPRPGDTKNLNYRAMLTDAGHQREVTISCVLRSNQCIAIPVGTYPARWKEQSSKLEILGFSQNNKDWTKTEYSVSTADNP